MTTEIQRTSDGDAGRYTLVLDGAPAGELDFRDDAAGRRAFTHTGVRSHHEGQGLAAQLVRRGLDDARAEGRKVLPHCSYVADYLDRHPEDQDLVAHDQS